MEIKTIVFDVDDTICIHTNRDYENAIPIQPVIDKINSFFDSGWKIILHTARGQISCNGDIELIQKKCEPVLKAWLDKHKVKYHELRFGKPIAVYYVDDKALRPDEFLTLDNDR